MDVSDIGCDRKSRNGKLLSHFRLLILVVESRGAIRMYQLFCGRPRKASCVVLLIAMTLMGCWIRSRVVRDWLTITLRGEVHDVISFNGRIHWWASAINLKKRTSIERTSVLNETQVSQH